MKKTIQQYLLTGLLLTLFQGVSYANDSTFIKNLYTGDFYPIKNDHIAMTHEKINIAVEYDYKNSHPGYNQLILNYNCNYTFKNNSSAEQTILLGFPVHYTGIYPSKDHKEEYRLLSGSKDRKEYFSRFPGMISFESLIDGSAVDFTRELFETNPDYPDLQYDEVYIFEVTFQPYEEKQIVNNYIQIAYPLVSSPYPLTNPVGFNYILRTGQLWNSPIKKGEVNVEINLSPDLFQITKMNPEFAEVSNKADKYILHNTFYNAYPKEDVYIEIHFTEIENSDVSGLISEMKTAVKNRDMKKCLMFSNYLIHQYTDISDLIPYDLSRKVMFWGANFAYFEEQYWTAVRLFECSISYGIKEEVDEVFWYFPLPMTEYYEIPEELLLNESVFSTRRKNEAPEYYAAYNIAAAESLSAKEVAAKADKFTHIDGYINSALKWLRIAYKINPKEIAALAYGDSDLAYLRENYPDEFKGIFE